MKKKKNSSIPRHKILKKESRLQAAICWIPKYDGENLVKGYSKHFAVDKLCAVKELTLLGYKINDEYIEQLKCNVEAQIRINRKRKELREEELRINTYGDSEDIFWEYFQEEGNDNQEANDYGDWCEEMPF